MGGDPSHSWRGGLRFTLPIWWGGNGAGLGAGNGQADLLPGHLGALRGTVRLQVFVGGGPLVAQVADLHDVSNNLHGSCDGLFTWRDVVLHLLQVRRRSPALFVLVPAMDRIDLLVSNDWSGLYRSFSPTDFFPCSRTAHGSRLSLPDEPPAFQVLLNHLHNDSLLEGDFVLPLAGVRLHRHVLLFCQEQRKDSTLGNTTRTRQWRKTYGLFNVIGQKFYLKKKKK